jgi:hypothetical protein
MHNKIRSYEVSISVSVTAHSEEEARAIACDLLLSRGHDRNPGQTAVQETSEDSLDSLFEDAPKANLDDLFEEVDPNAN